MKIATRMLGLASLALVLGGCAGTAQQSDGQYRAKAIAMLKSDFKPRGIAGLERLDQDKVQATCNETNNAPSPEIAKRLEAEQLATIKFPADGALLGDHKEGEKIAQSGRGFTWSDKPENRGGGCYNCHQIGPKETSYGTIGPSLYQFGKLRGYGTDVQKYVYSKIYNAKAFNACSSMPRFGYVGALDEKNIKDLVALLLDPESPVNK
jgi:sulfur-oxidizing protein SoxX